MTLAPDSYSTNIKHGFSTPNKIGTLPLIVVYRSTLSLLYYFCILQGNTVLSYHSGLLLI